VLNGRTYFTRACFVAGVICEVVFCWMATSGTWDLFQQRQLSNLYDAQARALFHGRWWMSAKVLSIEGIHTGAHEYMYYGPFPALLRMPVLGLTNRLDGRLTTVSMMVGLAVALVAVSRLAWKARDFVRESAPASIPEAVAGGFFVLVAGLGSILIWLASWTIVYHEAELWGAALTLAALDTVIEFVRRPSTGRALAAGLLAAAALLTRGSVAAGAVAALGVLCVAHFLARAGRGLSDQGFEADASSGAGPPTFSGGEQDLGAPRRPFSQRAANLLMRLGARPSFGVYPAPAGAPSPVSVTGRVTFALPLLASTVLPVAAYAWINEVKFGSLFGLPLQRQVYTAIDAHRRLVLRANHGSLFGLKYVATALLQYLRPDALAFQPLFPFVRFPPQAHVVGHVIYDTRDYSSSATTTMPLLVVLGIVGLVVMFSRSPTGARLGSFRVATAASLVGCFGALEIAYVANRYLSDFWPLLVLAGVAGYQVLALAVSRMHVAWRAVPIGVVTILGVGSIWFNVGLGLVYQRVLEPGIPITTRASFVSIQERIDSGLGNVPPSEVRQGPVLPVARGVPGSLFIAGRCSGLYQLVGGQWFAVEEGASAGHDRFEVTFEPVQRPTRQPLVTLVGLGANDILAVHYLGNNKIAFSYLPPLQGATWLDGSVVTIVPGESYTIDVTLDTALQEVSVVLDGNEDYDLDFFMVPGRVEIGRRVAPVAGLSPSFTGHLKSVPVATPLCDSILRRLR
jgi:hypothetical protein